MHVELKNVKFTTALRRDSVELDDLGNPKEKNIPVAIIDFTVFKELKESKIKINGRLEIDRDAFNNNAEDLEGMIEKHFDSL